MSLRARFWIVAIAPLLLAVLLTTWLFSQNLWNVYLQERQNKLTGVLKLMAGNFASTVPNLDKDSVITMALSGDTTLHQEARKRLNDALLTYNRALQNAMPTLGLEYAITALGEPVARVQSPETQGKMFIEQSIPLYWRDQPIGTARVWESVDDLRASFLRIRNIILMTVAGILVLALLMAYLVIESVNRDIYNLIKELPALKEQPLPLEGFRGEIRLVAETANKLASDLREKTQALNAVMENSPVGLALIKDGQVVLKNPVIDKMLPDLNERISHANPDYYHEAVKTADKNLSMTILRVSEEESIAVVEDLTDVIKMREAMALQERLAALGRFSTGIAHEIRNPLTAIRGFAQILAKRIKGEDKTYAEKILREAERVEKLVKDMLVYARPRPPEKKMVRVRELVESLVEQNPSVKVNVPEELEWSLDEGYVSQIITNLVGNALDANASEVVVEAEVKGPELVLQIKNNGDPIPEEHLDKIFEPFFTTKSTGTGLGLAIVRSAAEIQGGQVAVYNSDGWTVFAITFSSG
ncbi:acetyltransferase [Coprothermobacteraceae bacterium]|nr:acetyltransferase [Coprothermobacteraceae bacterium]